MYQSSKRVIVVFVAAVLFIMAVGFLLALFGQAASDIWELF
jgi:hypothetical protein